MKAISAILAAAAALAAVASVSGEVFMKETFDDAAWEERWTVGSEWKSSEQMGEWQWVTPKYQSEGKAIKTGEDARFYSLSAPLDAEVSNKGKDLVVSYTVKHEQTLDCGGAYIKLLPPGFDQKSFGGDAPYAIMFGPDVCGTSTRKTHAIFTYKGENLLTKKSIRCETDNLSHRYTFIVHPDNTYEVKIDGAKVESGSLFDDWEFLAPKEIKDPDQSKPSDWVDDAKIPDPEAVKPAGWDDVPATIPDPDAEKPEDWDEEEDGEWEAPSIDNPEYKGEWAAPLVDNPDYKGVWVHPMVPNPEYEEDDAVHAVCSPCSHVGFELWQVKAGTVFDDIFVGDSEEELEAWEAEVVTAKKDAEKEAYDEEKAAEAAQREEERKAREAEEAAKKAEEEAEADEEEEEDDEEEL